jgi:hypothetical protein
MEAKLSALNSKARSFLPSQNKFQKTATPESFLGSHDIAKRNKLFSVGEFGKQFTLDVIETLSREKYENTSLSRETLYVKWKE